MDVVVKPAVTAEEEAEEEPKQRRISIRRSLSSISEFQYFLYDPGRNNTIFAVIERNPWFQNATLLIIVINAIWISVDIQWNHDRLRDASGRLPLEPISTIVEHTFCSYFTFEVLVRFLAFRFRCYAIFDGWFAFDSVLVIFMVIETWILPLVDLFRDASNEDGGVLANFASFRLLRLLRLTRMARIMRFFPELMTIVKGMVNAMKAVMFILLFLVLTMYVFAIVFTSQLGSPPVDEGPAPSPQIQDAEFEAEAERRGLVLGDPDATAEEMFGTMPASMMSLFTNGVLGDNLYQTLTALLAAPNGTVLLWVFMVFVCISSITLLNMLIGVLCQVVEDTAKQEEEQNQVYELRKCLANTFSRCDVTDRGAITAEDWERVSMTDEVRESLENLGVDKTSLDTRLKQMQHALFGLSLADAGVALQQRPSRENLSAVDAAAPAAAAAPLVGEVVERGLSSKAPRVLSYDELLSKLADLRWDTPTNALDLEMLRREVLQDNKRIQGRLDQMEHKLDLVLNRVRESRQRSAPELPQPATPPASASPHSLGGGTAAKAHDAERSPGAQKAALTPTSGTPAMVLDMPGAVEAPAWDEVPGSPAPPPAAPLAPAPPAQEPQRLRPEEEVPLAEVPTELLFQVLKNRALQAGAELMKT
eukprot:TRINITY_DN1808_c0_g2_i1.p1 TRINITY_DN1808_c0_g2~~TRINITY_DN1808_c0_g2_i1.p1  ORF type:complete len:648 (-),score=153.38 TRINITY_DN1808_c0_g2_i1:360-2303(-)